MSEIITRDENSATIGAGVSSVDSASILMMRVDPVTGYVLTEITETAATAGNSGQIASRDQNHRTVVMGWNEVTQQPEEILTDVNGRILCDLLIV